MVETKPFVISLGDPAGIGPEITIKAWQARKRENLPPFFAVGDIGSLAAVWDGPVVRIDNAEESREAFDLGLPIIHLPGSDNIVPGSPTLEGAQCALNALEIGAGLARSGGARGFITAPVSKHQLYQVGYTHSGQTEFIAERCGVSKTNAVMMLVGGDLRVVPITTHVPLALVSSLLTIELIVARAHATVRGLQRSFGIEKPRLAVAGFNPHAGENGALGCEEQAIIAPAIERLRADGIDASGPYTPDAMFTPRVRATYDAALCMYHDQALIPLKTLFFDEGVNLTLGLPIVRTSPDHGTAFEIAGHDKAHPGAMIAAIKMAEQMALHRAATRE